MLNELACKCEATECERDLTDDDCAVVFRTDGGERRAYECDCGHVTITVARA